MKWETPSYTDLRFGFEVTMYIYNRKAQSSSRAWKGLHKKGNLIDSLFFA